MVKKRLDVQVSTVNTADMKTRSVHLTVEEIVEDDQRRVLSQCNYHEQ